MAGGSGGAVPKNKMNRAVRSERRRRAWAVGPQEETDGGSERIRLREDQAGASGNSDQRVRKAPIANRMHRPLSLRFGGLSQAEKIPLRDKLSGIPSFIHATNTERPRRAGPCRPLTQPPPQDFGGQPGLVPRTRTTAPGSTLQPPAPGGSLPRLHLGLPAGTRERTLRSHAAAAWLAAL